MHLTCTNMPVEKLDSALDIIKEAGLQNVLALRGTPTWPGQVHLCGGAASPAALDLVSAGECAGTTRIRAQCPALSCNAPA